VPKSSTGLNYLWIKIEVISQNRAGLTLSPAQRGVSMASEPNGNRTPRGQRIDPRASWVDGWMPLSYGPGDEAKAAIDKMRAYLFYRLQSYWVKRL
jgi:hypothetical protein